MQPGMSAQIQQVDLQQDASRPDEIQPAMSAPSQEETMSDPQVVRKSSQKHVPTEKKTESEEQMGKRMRH